MPVNDGMVRHYDVIGLTDGFTGAAEFIYENYMKIIYFFEIFEFILDSKNKPNNQRNQHGLADTDFDLIANVIGSVITGVASFFLIL